jgi:hypothetical protein
MRCNSLVLLSGLVHALAAVTTVIVESTVFYCPCTSSTLASSSSSISASGASSVSVPGSSQGSSIASSSPSGISTSTSISQISVTPTTAVSSPGTTISTSTAPTSSAPGTCIPLNGDCSNETQTFYCCSGLTCDVAIGNCVADN